MRDVSLAAGRLRHHVLLQRPVVTQDADGSMVTTWTDVANVWAEIAPSSGREFIAAAAEQSEVKGRFTIRHRDDIDASWRVVYRGKWFGILAVLPDPVSGLEYLSLPYSEGVRLDL